MKFNFGCGNEYKEGYINVDSDLNVKTDLIFDLEKDFPLSDECADYIIASHVIEHLHDLVHFMNECYRVLKPGGILELATPKPTCEWFWQDPTHVRGYLANTFNIYFRRFAKYNTYEFIKRWSNSETRDEQSIINGLKADILYVKMTK